MVATKDTGQSTETKDIVCLPLRSAIFLSVPVRDRFSGKLNVFFSVPSQKAASLKLSIIREAMDTMLRL